MAYSSSRRVDFPMVDLAKIMYYPRFWDLAHRFYEESWEYSCNRHYNEILIDDALNKIAGGAQQAIGDAFRQRVAQA